MASITARLRADGTPTFRVQFRIDGRMVQESFLDETGAAQFGSLVDRIGGDAARRVLDARRSNVGVPTLREWTASYLDPASGLLTGIEPGTRGDYSRIADRSFLPMLGDMPVNAIAKTDIGKWVEWQERQPANPSHRAKVQGDDVAVKPLAPKTIRNYHALLSSILAAAVASKLRDDNPAHRTRLSSGERPEAVFLSRAEFSQLLAHVPEEWQMFVLFMAGTGARWGEATALTWGDLNLDATPPTVRITKAWKKTKGAPLLKHPKTSRSNRTISLWTDLVTALGDLGPTGQLMFRAERGGKLWPGRFHDSVWRPAIAAANLAGMEKRPRIHDLRHTHASWLIAAGAPLPYVQARLGHESINTTINTYGHLLPDAHAQMSEMMSDTLSGAIETRLALTS